MARRLTTSFIVLAIVFFGEIAGAATAEAEKIIGSLETKQVKEFQLPKILGAKTRNGLKYYYLEDRSLPLTSAIIYMKGGDIYDLLDKSGLAALTADMVRSGGTIDMSPDEVDDFLDTISSTISVGSSGEYLFATIKCRSEHFEKSLNLLLDMFFRPRFDKKRFNALKNIFKSGVRRRADSPERLASVGFQTLLYGRQNPWGNYPTLQSVENISLGDIGDYHSKFFHQKNIIIGVSGDFDAAKLTDALESYKYYPSKEAVLAPIPKAAPKPVLGIHLIEKESNQAVLQVGHQGSERFNPDKYALIIMNDVLGGVATFKRRLPSLIRVEKGLAYSVGSVYTFGPENAPGEFYAFLTTKTASALNALELVIKELKRFADGNDISEDEVELSKRGILEGLIFEYKTPFDIIRNIVRFNYLGYPDDYIERYGKMIAKVKLDDVKNVAKKYIHPETLQVVLVGDGHDLEKSLNNNFKVKHLTIDN